MRLVISLARSTAVLMLHALVCSSAFCCEQIPAGQTIWIRLTSPVSTYTAKPGDAVKAVLTEAIKCETDTDFPVGTDVSGVVHAVRKVGWGIYHETAALEITFNELHPGNGPAVAFVASITEVENAREHVSKGTIQGIRSSDTPEGRINSRLRHLPTYNPYSDLGLIVYKATFPIFPEPEIYYPAGTDMRLRLMNPVHSLPVAAAPSVESTAKTSEELDVEQIAPSLPWRSTTTKLADADVVNLAFVGSREQVEAAFQQAGWSTSDAFTRHSFMRDFYAFLNNSSYDQAPMKPLLLDGRSADLSWQKSLNSYNRRDHLRIWQWSETSDSEIVWLSSSTHDTRATL